MSRQVVRKKPYFGLDFTEVLKLSVKVPVTTTIDRRSKLAFTGILVLDFHKNSYRYDNEAVLAVWSYSYPVVKARSSNRNYGRSEIILPLSCEVRDFLMACACEVDAHLKGVK
ncbi:hypothetical protein KAU88_07600 [Candidatus Bathyarchaeota archaeon]|nr:hypothetical protein [Candidatus Bathyarchaeota archaeon]